MAEVVPSHERQCAVCTNDFTTPKILPCGHLLCRECVVTLMDSIPNAGCPLCRCPIVEHQGNSSQSSADAVDALPTDSVMEAIVESAYVLKGDMCTVCDDVTAEYICMECLEKMCPSCMRIHKRMIATRSHDVESVSTVTPERLAASRPALCADHGDKQAELFCVRHNLSICTLCGCNKNSDCRVVRYMDDQMMYAVNELGLLTNKLVWGEDNLGQAIGNLNLDIQYANATEQRNIALVDNTCDCLQKMVEECRKQQKKLISDSYSTFRNSLGDVKSDLEKRLGKVTSHKHLVTRAAVVRPRPAVIHAATALTDRVNSLDLGDDLMPLVWVDPSPQIAKWCSDVRTRIQAQLPRVKQQGTELAAHNLFHFNRTGFDVNFIHQYFVSPLVFHENCGAGIRLMNCNMTAWKFQSESNGDGVVVSRDAMVTDVLYEVRVDKIGHTNSMFLGVTETPPPQLTVTTFYKDLKDSIMIWHSGVWCKGYHDRHGIGEDLKYIKVGSRVGVLVDSSNRLHLYVNGKDKGVAPSLVMTPCFAVFDLRNNDIQVTSIL